jgi:hypothetical protein
MHGDFRIKIYNTIFNAYRFICSGVVTDSDIVYNSRIFQLFTKNRQKNKLAS